MNKMSAKPQQHDFKESDVHVPDSQNSSQATRWNRSVWAFVVAVLLVGPLALPMLWSHPTWPKTVKWTLSVVIMVITAYLLYTTFYLADSVTQALHLGNTLQMDRQP